jgi:hypothetical protein
MGFLGQVDDHGHDAALHHAAAQVGLIMPAPPRPAKLTDEAAQARAARRHPALFPDLQLRDR